MSSRAHRAQYDPWSAWMDYAMGVGESWFAAMYPTQRHDSATGRAMPSAAHGGVATGSAASQAGNAAAAPVAPAIRR